MDRRKLLTGLLALVPASLAVTMPALAAPVKVTDLTDPALWRGTVIQLGKSAVGTDEKGTNFQGFLMLLDMIEGHGCRVSKYYGRVYGPDTGGKDIVDTIWVKLGGTKMLVFYSERSVYRDKHLDIEEVIC